ncbi:hypothetical protein PG993_009047 [Apiospora rasikravindrae]|uniref:Uncharacterized protein n=1 Tax=Apiospora rasikravindrae TaxID=990691 RepID=A0ABR1SIA6_9PEZI
MADIPSSLAPPEPTKLQRDIVARPSSWFIQSPLCVAAGLATAKYFFKVDFRSLRGRRVLAGSAFAYAVMTPFDVWYWRRARDAVVDRNGWEMRQKRTGYPVAAPRGVRGADGEWTTETAASTSTATTTGRSSGDGIGIGSGSGSVPTRRFGGGSRDGARDQGGYAGGAGDEEELQDPWALPQSKKGGSSRWS